MDTLKHFCVFCGEKLETNTVVVEKGLKTIIETSLRLNDGLGEKLKGQQKIVVHKKCRLNHTRPTTIVATIRKSEIPDINLPSTSSLPSSVLRSTAERFDFKSDCFLCGKKAKIDTKAPSQRRKPIHLVTTIEIREKTLRKCDEREDDWGERVKIRLLSVSDLVAPKARYHKYCYRDFCISKPIPRLANSRQTQLKDSFYRLCEHIEESDECQFTLKELQDLLKEFSCLEETYSDRHLKNLLKDHFKDRLFISNISERKNLICLSDCANKLVDRWYKERNSDHGTERLRIVQAAADIIREDIQKMTYNNQTYPTLNEIRAGSDNLVPGSLKTFTSRVTKKKTGDDRKTERKCTVINHAIISTLRPRSFLSPVQTGIGLTLHRLYGSKHLIDLLASMGVCVSYNEVNLYMNSLIKAGSPKISDEAFIQYVFDNADVNVRTLDGLNTFHAMGGIKCITPSTSVETQVEVERIASGSFVPETVRILSYARNKSRSGLSKIKIEDIDDLRKNSGIDCKTMNSMSPINVMWLATSNIQPGWNGYMTSTMRTQTDCEGTYILGVPFVNMDPSNPSTVYPAISYAADECEKQNRNCINTFDQPLYLKASETVASANPECAVSKIISRLGGFHLLMSFMDSVGKIMEGSGLEELWTTVYGRNTVTHMLNGHAYARCVRAYSLNACALINVMKDQFSEIKDSLTTLETFSKELLQNKYNEAAIIEDSTVKAALNQFNESLNNVQTLSRTTKLWINLLKCIDLMMMFIYAERSGNWNLHLRTTIEMLPYFHAAGHLPYAKSAHLYAQEMTRVGSKLSPQEFGFFKERGHFTVRRTGTWTDMCIEQGMMRPMKSVGGLTHGRGITDSTLSKWVLGTPFFFKIHEAVEDYFGTSIQYNEQHVELRVSRRKRDLSDLQTFTTWFQAHNAFTKLSGELVSLTSGFVCDDSINCDEAYDVGLAAINKMKGTSFHDIKLHRKDMVETQAMRQSALVRSKQVSVNSQQLFNRILCVCDSPGKLKTYLEFELAPRPPSLFDDVSLRRGTKSSLMKVFEEGVIDVKDQNGATYVLDGGFLLHKIAWPRNCTYGVIFETYCKYIVNRYGSNSIVVFDGYPDEPTTKNEEQNRRATKKSSPDIIFDENTVCVTGKEEFLGNTSNKRKLVLALTSKIRKRGLQVVTAEDDADVQIVMTAIQQKTTDSKVFVVGTDTDLIVLLTELAPVNTCIYFCKEKGGAVPSTLYYRIASLIEKFGDHRQLLLFCHAMTGCDTTSSLYGMGKLKALELLTSNPEIQNKAKLFLDISTTREDLSIAGEKFVLCFYGLDKYSNLNEARYYKFLTLTKKSSLRSNFDLAKLPPTSEACREHSLRVFLQVQKWLGKSLDATNWGWQFENVKEIRGARRTLKPIPNSKPFAPNELLYLVSCSCKQGCGHFCGCRKANLSCTAMCEHCSGLSCLNSPLYSEEEGVEFFHTD